MTKFKKLAAMTSPLVPPEPPPPDPPDPPTGLIATAGDTEVQLTWNSTANTLTYNIKQALVPGGPYTTIASTLTPDYLDTSLINGVTYYYVVSAVNGFGESADSAEADATPVAAPPPDTPTGLTATAGDTEIALDWNASIGATSYNIKRALVTGGPYATIATSTLSQYLDTALINGIDYFYVVSAVNANGESGDSSEADATPVHPPPPDPPTGLIATAGDTEVGLTWNASVGATSYNVKRSLIMGGPYATIAITTLTNYLDTGLTNGTPYFYVVSAVNGNGESANSSEATATPTGVPPPDPPDPPTGLVATPGDTTVQLAWNGSLGAVTYNVKRSTVSGGPYTTIASPGVTNYLDTGRTNGVTYYYVVSAVNGNGESANSSQVSATPVATPPPPPPDPPTGLTIETGDTRVRLSWNASAGATGYKVKRALVTGGPYTVIATPTATHYVNSGLTNGTTYFYVVSATNANGESGNSSEVNATPTAPGSPPDPPTGLTATAGNTQITLSWNSSFGATSYNVKRSLVMGGPYSTIANVATTNYLDTGLTNGTPYYYVVSALNGIGESADSSEATATPVVPPPPPPPDPPTGLVAVAGDTQIQLSWNSSVGATGYKVKRSLVTGGPYTTIATPSVTHYTNTGLTNGVTYYYVVTATNVDGESTNSLEVNATPVATGTPPDPPTGLTATAGNTQISLSWNSSITATSYNVKRSLIMGGPYSTIINVASTSYINTGLTNGTPYFYVVSALNAFGESANSSEATATPTAPPPTGLRGVVIFGGSSLEPSVLNNPDVDGCVARDDWGTLETSAGVFNWASMDAQVAAIVAAGRKLVLGVATGGDTISAGGHKPNWLYPLILSNGGILFSYYADFPPSQTGLVTIPAHWDSTFLSRKASMIAAVGARYASEPVVCVRLQYMNAHTEDYNPGATYNTPDGIAPPGSSPQSRWLAAGWTETKLVNAGNTTFAAYDAAFPNALLEIAIGKITNAILAPSGGEFVNDTVIATARTNYPDRVFATKNSVTARTPTSPGTGEWRHLWDLRPDATQMLSRAFNDPSHRMGDNDPATNLTDAVNQGAGYGNATQVNFWQEIYEIDAINLPDVIHYAHLLMNP